MSMIAVEIGRKRTFHSNWQLHIISILMQV
jgi:hypothetical protein